MNNLDDIVKLLHVMAELPFESMEVSTAEATVRVKRGGEGGACAEAAGQKAVLPRRPQDAAAEAGAGEKTVAVPSPIIGVFYAAPSPDDAPYVRVGDRVRAGQTLCIVEAMKLMNEIPSPVAGTVLKVMANDGGEVEVGQTLFLLEASEG